MNLLLQGKDMGNTAVNRIANPCLSFISNGDNRLTPISHRNMQQQFRNITSTKHLVNGRESSWALFRAKIRSKNAISGTLSPQELACTTRRACPTCHNIYSNNYVHTSTIGNGANGRGLCFVFGWNV